MGTEEKKHDVRHAPLKKAKRLSRLRRYWKRHKWLVIITCTITSAVNVIMLGLIHDFGSDLHDYIRTKYDLFHPKPAVKYSSSEAPPLIADSPSQNANLKFSNVLTVENDDTQAGKGIKFAVEIPHSCTVDLQKIETTPPGLQDLIGLSQEAGKTANDIVWTVGFLGKNQKLTFYYLTSCTEKLDKLKLQVHFSPENCYPSELSSVNQKLWILNSDLTEDLSPVYESSLTPVTVLNSPESLNHILILMQENRSFDAYFGQINQYRASVKHGLDDIDPFNGIDWLSIPLVPDGFSGLHNAYVTGDITILKGNPRAEDYGDVNRLPYWIASNFAVSDAWFAAAPAPMYAHTYFKFDSSVSEPSNIFVQPPTAAGWNNTNVAVAFSCASATLSQVSCGNQNENTPTGIAINIDKAFPVIDTPAVGRRSLLRSKPAMLVFEGLNEKWKSVEKWQSVEAAPAIVQAYILAGTVDENPFRIRLLSSGGAHLHVTSSTALLSKQYYFSHEHAATETISERLRTKILNSGGAHLTITSHGYKVYSPRLCIK